MEGNQIAGDGVAGMSKNQLYHIMNQMKTLIEQNKEQAKQILIQNPAMTRALFQAQIMLGMVQPPQSLPTTPQTTSRSPQTSADQQSNVQAAPTGQKQRRVEQPSQTLSSSFQSETIPPTISQARSVPSHSLQKLQQPKHKPTKSIPQSSQVPSITQGPQYTASQITSVSHQPQQTLQNIGGHHMPLKLPSQSPLPPQTNPSMPTFPHQGHSQTGLNMGGFQHPTGPTMQHSPVMSHSSPNPPAGLSPPFQQGQLQRLNQPSPSPNYQVSISKGTDRAPNWAPEATTGQPTLSFSSHVGSSNQPPRPQQPLSPELEKALLQQVMSLTPEQINLLPPDQRNQILQLQQVLRR